MSGGTAGEPAGVVVHLGYERPADAVERLCRVFGLQETDRMAGSAGRTALVAAGAGRIRRGPGGLAEAGGGGARGGAPRRAGAGRRAPG